MKNDVFGVAGIDVDGFGQTFPAWPGAPAWGWFYLLCYFDSRVIGLHQSQRNAVKGIDVRAVALLRRAAALDREQMAFL